MSVEQEQAQSGGNPLGFLFSFKGRIGRGQFLIGFGVIVALAVCLLAAAAGFMDPRGGVRLFISLTILFLIAVAWIHCAIVVKRLRDAGFASWYWFIFGPGPFVLLLLAAEYLRSLWWLALLGSLALIIAPAFFATRSET
jgi:uncharacterized membrane protein YhaH (DUF805 family)